MTVAIVDDRWVFRGRERSNYWLDVDTKALRGGKDFFRGFSQPCASATRLPPRNISLSTASSNFHIIPSLHLHHQYRTFWHQCGARL